MRYVYVVMVMCLFLALGMHKANEGLQRDTSSSSATLAQRGKQLEELESFNIFVGLGNAIAHTVQKTTYFFVDSTVSGIKAMFMR